TCAASSPPRARRTSSTRCAGWGTRCGSPEDPERFLPGSEPEHVGATPGPRTVGGTTPGRRAMSLRSRFALAFALVAAVVAGLVAAAAAGWLLARRITGRLVRLTGIAEEVSRSGRVDHEVPVDGRDEVGRLSASFNTMLGRLAASRESQERLVQDAAHELR